MSPRGVVIALIRVYQRAISPLLPDSCRFYPSCSQYAVSAIQKHGALKGVVISAWRLMRCNPFSKGGFDPVK